MLDPTAALSSREGKSTSLVAAGGKNVSFASSPHRTASDDIFLLKQRAKQMWDILIYNLTLHGHHCKLQFPEAGLCPTLMT